MKKLVIALQLLFFASVVFAGNDKGVENKKETVPAEAQALAMVITGKVVDQVTGEALTGVKVAIEGSDLKAYTDFDGSFSFSQLSPGEYKVVTNYISYQKHSQVLKVDTKQSQVEIKLTSSK